MCGICGKAGPAPISDRQIGVMADRLASRGPDDHGVHVEPGMGLGHRRLSIIDLAGGHQPLANEDHTVWITFNGEIYNYADLRKQLLAEGHVFRTNSDTETIVHLYESKGERCVEDLRGMFAFAVWDARRRKLFLARDHLGQKPLYYAIRGETLTFASEIKALLADDPSLAEVNLDALKEYLTIRVISGSRSMFKDVRKLPPGHTLAFEGGKAEVRRYWDLNYRPKSDLSERDAVEALDEQLREAVRLHLVSDVEVGAFLSGGLDSSLVVAVMSQLAGPGVKTFSVGVPYKGYSELPYAEAVTRNCHTRPFTDEMPLTIRGMLPKVIWHLDEPSDALAPCMFYLAEFARRQVKVVLGGDGGDELFGGYDRYFGNRYVSYYAALPRVLREKVLGRLIRHVPEGYWYKSLSHRLRWLHELSSLAGGSRYARSLSYFYFAPGRGDGLFGPVLRSEAGGFEAEESIRRYFDAARADELIDRMLYADCKVRLPNHSVMILDRATMAYGLEARSPLLDHRLAEFAATLPARLKVRGTSLRYIQTRLARKYLPRKIVSRRKCGFSSALPYLLADEFRFLFRQYLRDSHLVAAGLLEGPAIGALLDEHLAGRRDHGNRLWLLANLELWYRMHIEGLELDALTGEIQDARAPVTISQ